MLTFRSHQTASGLGALRPCKKEVGPQKEEEEPLQADAAPGDVPRRKEEEEPQKAEEPQKGVLTLKLNGRAATVAVKKKTHVNRKWHGRERTHEGRGTCPGGRNEDEPWRKEQHLNKKTFDEHQLDFKPMDEIVLCNFSKRPKYEMQLMRPNDFNLDWVYSVPCGELDENEDPCQSWIFLNVPKDIRWNAGQKKKWVARYLEMLDWVEVSKATKRRFICPKCAKDKQ